MAEPRPLPHSRSGAGSLQPRDAPTLVAFSRQAAEGSPAVLTCREDGLCPGAKLAVMTMALDQDGEFGYRPLLNAMHPARVDMVESGFLSGEKMRRMVIPTVGRSQAHS